MKFKHLLIGSLFATIAASCSNDMPSEPGQILENETSTFIRVSIMDQSGTRAGAANGYELGSPDESMIKSILLTFFDAGRNYVGKTEVQVNEDNTIEVPGEANTIERVKTLVAQVNLPENINYPKYVVAYVNPTTQSGDLATEKLEDVMRFLRERASVSKGGYRTMNNSVYFDETTGFTRYATEVDFKTQFFESWDEAKDAKEATIEITVERVEAKVRLSTPLNDIVSKPVESGAATTDAVYKLEFVPEMWFVNGTEKRTFLIKNYRKDRNNFTSHMATTDYGFSLSELQTAFQTGGWTKAPDFNDYGNLRSYWAIDPTYFMENEGTGDFYPDISYDVRYGDINSSARDYPLLYRSYNSVRSEYTNGQSTDYVNFNSNGKSHEYVLENTMSINTLRSLDAKAAMTSVVLLGHYVIKDASGTTVFNGNENDFTKSFYIRHEATFDDDNNQASKIMVMLNDRQGIDFFIERSGSTFYVQKRNADGSIVAGAFETLQAAHLDPATANSVNYGITHDDFELVYPGTDVTNGKKQSEQWRTLGVKKTNGKYNDNLYVYDYNMNNGEGGYKKFNELDADELDAFNDRMYSSFGVIEKYQGGKAYFNVPLKHIWGKLGSTNNEFTVEGLALGHYGVVRNHIYDLSIGTISGLGTGIGDIRQPIVPPTENDQFFISTRFNILQWRLVKQSVDL